MIVTITNPNKNQSVYFYGPEEWENRYGRYSWNDLPCIRYAANEYVFPLLGMSGFKILPKSNDTRNTTISTHGSSRVSGYMDELELTIQTISVAFCQQNDIGEYPYNYLSTTVINETGDLVIYFNLGCKTIYQYYSYQSQDAGEYEFMGNRPEVYYYIDNNKAIYGFMRDKRFFSVPTIINRTIDDYSTTENVVGISGSQVKINHLNVLETPYQLDITPYRASDSYIVELTININGSSLTINKENYPLVPGIGPNEDRIKKVSIKENKDIVVDDIIVGNALGILPTTLTPGESTINITSNIQKGDYIWQLFKENNVEY